MRSHTRVGERIIAAAPALSHVAQLVRHSHERWDGAGYPDRLTATEIPIGSRIIAVADAFDAMTQPRPYRRALGLTEALGELELGAGTQFDPSVVAAFTSDIAGHASDGAPAAPTLTRPEETMESAPAGILQRGCDIGMPGFPSWSQRRSPPR